MYLLRLTLVSLLLFPGSLFAQSSGWDFIRQNNFVLARPAFEAALRQNPGDEPALTGMLFLAETVRDQEAYERYANQLLDSHWRPEYVWLFQRLYNRAPEVALQRDGDNPDRLPVWTLQQADTLFKYRRFAESTALRTAVLPDWNWALCGPFTNVAGSGFIEEMPVEIRPFQLQDSFEHEEGLRFRWLPRPPSQPGAPVDFSDLPRPSDLGTYFANTFIDVPTARPVALRITRNTPVKIWLDDQLLVARARPEAGEEWDSEILHFELPAGIHRLFIKMAEFSEESPAGRIRLAFNDINVTDEEADSYDSDDLYGTASGPATPWFALRFTDPVSGQLYTDLRTSLEGRYTPAQRPWETTLDLRPQLQRLLEAWRAEPEAAWRLYLVAKAYAKYGAWEESEAWLAGLCATSPEAGWLHFLLAKCYDNNGKSERAEALLSAMDTTTAPTLAEHFVRLLKINKEQAETQYLQTLEDMLQLSPTNWYLLDSYLSYLKDKGRQEQVRAYVRRFLEQHNTPRWKNRLEEYLENDTYKPETRKTETDSDREKRFQQARKRLKKTFVLADYNQVIRYYKQKDRPEEVLKTYDELLAIVPYLNHFRLQKAAYLFEIERQAEALTFVLAQHTRLPYDPAWCELAGDIYFDQKQEAEALAWYRRAERLRGQDSYALAAKIEKLDNHQTYSGYFDPINLDEVAKDRSWLPAFAGEEAVVGLFAQQVTYRQDQRKFESANKCVIHIRTEAGAKRWTEADLSLMGTVTSARIVKKDGTVTSPELGWGGVAVFKNLQPGDVILLEGTSERGMPEEFSADMLDLAFCSWPAPVARATYELLLPAGQALHFAYNRLSPAHTVQDTGAYKRYRWEWRDLPKMEEEEAMPDNIDAMAWIMYGSAADWSPVVRWYLRKTYARTDANYEVLDRMRALIRPGMTEADIVETLHTFITRDISYSYVPFLNSNYTPKTPGATLSARVGDCKDVAALMIAMLREQGIPAWFTLVSTHSFSNNEPRPTAFVFNHAIVAYETRDGQLHFDDLTTDYFPNGILPASDAAAWGLVIRPGETQLRRLPNHAMDATLTRVSMEAEAVLDTLGHLTLDTRIERRGTAAGYWREIFLRMAEAERGKTLAEYFGGGVLSHVDIETAAFEALDSINAPLRLHAVLKAWHQMDQVANLYILPLPLPYSTPTHKALFAGRRYNDLDADVFFELAPVSETVRLRFPPGFALAEVPKNRTFQTPFGYYRLSFEPLPGGLTIHRELAFAQRFIGHADFGAFKQFYMDMLEADDSLLALRR